MTSNHRRLEGARVLVTGAGTGIGRGIALEFAKEGASVALHYSRSAEGALAAEVDVTRSGGKAKAFQADLSQLHEIQDLAVRANEFLGGIDVLVNNAGITMNKPFLDVTPEQYDRLFEVNTRAPFFLTQAVIPTMKNEGNGTVINLTSNHAFAGMTEHTVYAGTRAAIVGFTRVLALEMAPLGIRVNAIAPGWILVENQLKAMPDLDREVEGRAIPAGRIGDPWDVARLAIFLATDDARYVIGQTFVIDGGQTAIMALTGDIREGRTVQLGQGYVPGL